MVEEQSNAVVALCRALLDRWNARDAAGMAGLLIADGFIVGIDGSELDSPAEVEASLRQIFEHHQTPPYVAKVRTVRFLNSDVAVLRGAAGMIPPGKADLDPAINAIQTLVAVRRDFQWRVAVFQNTRQHFMGVRNWSKR